MGRRIEITVAAVGVILTAIALIFGDNIYLQISGHSIAQDFHSQTIPLNVIQNLASRNLLTTTSGAVIWQSKELILEYSGEGAIYQSTESAPTDFVFFSSVMWDSPDTEFTACGFFFRSNNQNSNYASLLRRNGNALLWRMVPTGVERWLASEFIQGINKANNGTNKLILIVQGNRFVFLVNDTVVYYGTDNVYATGYVGIMTGAGPNGANTCTFRDSWLWVIK